MVRCALGILAAALLFELGLRPFVAGGKGAIRNYYEGVSVAHFEPDGLGTYGNRLTGNPPLAGAREGLILGDSHVIAQAVRDEETMGAVVERDSRAAGHPLNVRQYGWSSANAGTFLAAADALLKARNPAWVAVVLNADNIGIYALTTTQNWRMEVAPDDSVRLIDMRPSQAVSRAHEFGREIGRSTLALALWRRFGQIRNRSNAEPPDPDFAREAAQEAARVPRATVLGLKKAYGSRLVIVYVPYFEGTNYASSDPVEQEVLELCAQNEVDCFSMRKALALERYENFRLSRGFHNTAPGVGHFNSTGHRVIGTQIWNHLAWRSSR